MTDVFPDCIVDVLALYIGGDPNADPDPIVGVTGVENVEKRALEPTHPNGSVGIFAKNWVPLDHEIGAGDTRGKYNVVIQTLCKFSDREEGITYSARLVKSIRVMVYRDPNLRVALSGLSESISSVTERTFRWGIGEQRFQNNLLRGEFVFASVSEFWLETEVT